MTSSRKCLAPSARSVTSSRKCLAPSARSVTSSRKCLAPSARSVTSSRKCLAPSARSVTSSRKCLGPSAGSVTSSRSSLAPKAAELAVEAAGLTAKLRHIENEAKVKAELDKIQTVKQLDVAEAQLEAIAQFEREDGFEFEDHRSDWNIDYVDQYVPLIVTPAPVTPADDGSIRRTMPMLSSASEHTYMPAHVCVGNVGGLPTPEAQRQGHSWEILCSIQCEGSSRRVYPSYNRHFLQ